MLAIALEAAGVVATQSTKVSPSVLVSVSTHLHVLVAREAPALSHGFVGEDPEVLAITRLCAALVALVVAMILLEGGRFSSSDDAIVSQS